ncbi:MAG: transglycosylase domain-containing protein, partial [Bacteroidia bacterium]
MVKRITHWLKAYYKKNRFKSVAFACFVIATTFFFAKRDSYFHNAAYSTTLLSSNQKLLSAQIANDGQWRFESIDSIPDQFVKCITLFEDEYFDYHIGVNPISLARATLQNLKAKRIVSGGSTITMQVVRMGRNATNRSVWQKFKEILWAIRLETHYSKSEILNLYVNHAPFGGNVVGIQAAAWRYFNRNIYELSWAEYAVLAVLPNAPSLIHPGKNQIELTKKRNRLLNKLLSQNIIDSTEYELALLENIPKAPLPLPQMANHMLQ